MKTTRILIITIFILSTLSCSETIEYVDSKSLDIITFDNVEEYKETLKI